MICQNLGVPWHTWHTQGRQAWVGNYILDGSVDWAKEPLLSNRKIQIIVVSEYDQLCLKKRKVYVTELTLVLHCTTYCCCYVKQRFREQLRRKDLPSYFTRYKSGTNHFWGQRQLKFDTIFPKKCHFRIISHVQWWTQIFYPILHSSH